MRPLTTYPAFTHLRRLERGGVGEPSSARLDELIPLALHTVECGVWAFRFRLARLQGSHRPDPE